ncbi:hypothetical protein [Cytobacillus praedii]|uniref:Uncharacterized protein n=1 Tax=Cytobacillus praedii TaxID=1742358 RepID=A0A4R1AK69_9BACI|nr:hypothetical protein [Cytobacillus praedii]TCI99994.1 hypothetical protein E0Y62_27040 [Cytobacillus praedii]
MNRHKDVLSNLVKNIYYQFPNKIKISSDLQKVKFDLNYSDSMKIANKLGWTYYFGTEIKYSTPEEFFRTFKELLKIKRALKEIYSS